MAPSSPDPLQTVRMTILGHLLIITAAPMAMVMASGSAESAPRSPPGGAMLREEKAVMTSKEANHEYYVDLYMGELTMTKVSGIADTGSDITWLRCEADYLSKDDQGPCEGCQKMNNIKCFQGQCTYVIKYGRGYSTGIMKKAKLRFAPDQVSTFVVDIGCAAVSSGISKSDDGIVGLGRGKMSLVKLLKFGKFSYCLNAYNSPSQGSSHIKFGAALPDITKNEGSSGWQKTPLKVIDEHPSKYYVQLNSIWMAGDGEALDIPDYCFHLNEKTGDGGMFIDSGASFSTLPKNAFDKVKKRISDLMAKNLGPNTIPRDNNGFTCYPGKEIPKGMPNMELHFAGDAKMVLPAEKYMIVDRDNVCIAIKTAPSGFLRTFILGNFQQQNMHMHFDISQEGTAGELSFAPAANNCDEPK